MKYFALLVRTEISEWFGWVFWNIPGRIGIILRRLLLYAELRRCGKNLLTGLGCRFFDLKNIEIGEDVAFIGGVQVRAGVDGSVRVGSRVAVNIGTIIDASCGSVEIGNDCIIGPNVIIRASNHAFSRTDVPIQRQGHSVGRIAIEEDVWIAAGAIILPNVILGRGCIVGAGAVVVRDVPAGMIVGGVPARQIGKRDGLPGVP